VDVTYDYPNAGTVAVDYGTFTVTGSEDLVNEFNDESLGFSDTQITLTNLTPGAFLPNPFDGYEIQFLSGPAIVNVTYDPSSSSDFATGSVLNFSSDEISLSVAGTCSACVGGEQIILDVTTASATPEPSSFALFGSALIGLGGVLRLKRKSA
jgi:hypothetical protein